MPTTKELADEALARFRAGVPVGANEYLTDKEVCSLLRCQRSTLRRLLNETGRRRKYRPGEVDLRKVNPVVVGGQRRWNRARLVALLNAQ